MREDKTLYVVVPCYREEAALPETARRLEQKLRALMAAEKISAQSRVLFVNDGSRDRTWPIIADLHARDALFSGVNLSRNRGHQNALLAGLMTAMDRADLTISMDADLQDDIDAMDAMIDAYHNGFDVVYGVRSARAKDSAFKRRTAEGFYRLMQRMGVDLVFNHADYRLMSRRALQGLAQFREVNLFLRGIVPQIGYPSTTVEYARGERFAGESKYPLKKMLALALDGVTSFSVKPLGIIALLGGAALGLGLLGLLAALIALICGARVGLTLWLLLSVWLLGGAQLLGLGVVGQYVGKIYNETKARPRYLIEQVLDAHNE